MAGELTIQRLPVGLLDLLAMKGSGQTPQELSPLVQPVVNIDLLYLAQKQIQVAAVLTPNVNATGPFMLATPPIPQSEIWAVKRISAYWPSGAASSISFRPCYVRRGFNGLTAQTIIGQFVASGGASTNPATSIQFAPWELFFPGDNFGVWSESWAGVAAPANMQIEYIPLVA